MGGETFPGLFEAQVDRNPDAVAVRFEETTLTYGELERRANRVAWVLRERGVRPETLSAVILRRSPEMVVAILAVLKAGGAFLPLDPRMPEERVRAVVEDAGVLLALTSRDLARAVPRLPRVLVTDAKGYRDDRPPGLAAGEHAAYVIYTSGSTGRPKGVAIENRSLVAYIEAVLGRLEIDAPMTFGHVSTFAADLGHTALFPALATGGTLNVISSERQADPVALAGYLLRHPVDVLKIVPSHLSALLSGGRDVLPRKRLVLGGEALSWELVERVRSCFPACDVFNHYGPTETTVGVIAGPVPGEREGRTVPIGLPLPHAGVALLDPEGRPVPEGEPGEAVISGMAVGRGYWRGERFDGVYRTGDLVRRLPSGNLEFVGRRDDQVKIRGYRVEPAEVRAAISRLGIENVVVPRDDPRRPGECQLVAYLVRPAMPPSDVERRLRKELPEFMVPSVFAPIDALPLTANGKVDRKALPEPEREKSGAPDEPSGQFEVELTTIWRRHLGRSVGAHEDFFDAGGHSLIAAKIAAEASRRFDCDVPPTLLLEKPTIASLARELRRKRRRAWSPLVPIQPHGTRRPLFCVHGGMGTVMFYGRLASILGPDRPVYGLQPRGLYDSSRPNTSVEELAADYVRAIRRVQPRGPYALTGRCFGAIFALEMAQQLLAAGEEIRDLVALDGGPDLAEEPPATHWVDRRLRDLRSVRTPAKAAALWRKAWRKAEACRDDLALRGSYVAGEMFRKRGLTIPSPLRACYARENHRAMIERYVARRYPGSVLVIRWHEYQDPWMGWKQIVDGTAVLEEVADDTEAWRVFRRALGRGGESEFLVENREASVPSDAVPAAAAATAARPAPSRAGRARPGIPAPWETGPKGARFRTR